MAWAYSVDFCDLLDERSHGSRSRFFLSVSECTSIEFCFFLLRLILFTPLPTLLYLEMCLNFGTFFFSPNIATGIGY